jgi:hypothetical protein
MVISSFFRNVLFGTAVVLVALLVPKVAFSQAFSLFNVDASGYPTIKAGFFVANGNGQPLEGIPSDFRIIDNGVDVTPSVKVTCREAGQCDLSVSLVVDKSGSMLEAISPTRTRWDAVKFGINSFLNTVDFNGKNEVSLTSFDGMGFLNANFTTAKQPIIDALNFINPSNSTKYNEVLLTALRDPLNYRNVLYGEGTIGLLSQRPPNNCKVILFLTDGLPIEATNVNQVIQRCQQNAIRFYSISIGVEATELKQIANATGGKAFVVQNITEQNIKAVYDVIAAELKGTKVCELEWQAPFGCTQASRQRLALVRFNRSGLIDKTDTARYTAPDYSVAPITASRQVLSFGDVDANLSKEDELTFTVPIDGYTISSINLVPTITQYEIVDIFVNQTARPKPFQFPFQLNKGDVLRIRVKFTQTPTKMFHQTELVVNGIPCSSKIPVVGGLQTVKLIKPDGSEELSTCDTFAIVWAGVDSTTLVDIQYSEVDPPQWKPLVNGVSGLVYLWNPTVKGKNYYIRIVLPPTSFYQWVKQVGSSGPDTVSSIALNPNQDLLYSTGAFSNTVTFNTNTTHTSTGNKDIFVGQHNPISGDFNWVTKIGSTFEEVPAGVIVDGNNVWVTGASFATGSIGVSPLSFDVPSKMGVFLARLDPNTGAATITNTDVSASQTWNQFEAYPEQVHVGLDQNNNRRVWVTGKYRNRLAASALRNLPDATNWSTFTATFNENGQLVMPLAAGKSPALNGPTVRSSVQITTDLTGNRFESGSFTGDLVSGGITRSAIGGVDGYVRRFGGVPGNSDYNLDTFKVDAPKLKTETPLIDLGTVCIGEDITHLAASTLCNEGSIPLTVTNAYFKVGNEEFKIISAPIGQIILGDICEFFNIEVAFKPTKVGPFTGVLVIEGTCSEPIEITYFGIVEDCCFLSADPLYDFQNVDVDKNKLSQAITIKNNGLSTKFGDVKISPNVGNVDDFNITTGGGGFILPSNQTHTVIVEFTPKEAGLRTAELDWGFDVEDCGEQITTLIGNGVNIVNVAVTSLDFDRRRVSTVNTMNLTLTNGGTSAMTIESVDGPNTQGGSNSFLPANPAVAEGDIIQPNEQKEVGVRFEPQIEGNIAGNYTFTILNQQGTLVANLRGFGFLPKISSSWDCGLGAKIGDSIINNLVITNPSTTSDLFIESINFQNNAGGNFSFVNPPPQNVTVAMNGGTLIIPIRYAPTAGGASSVIVNVVNDAAPGPDENPRITTAIPISCSSSGVVVPTVEFGSVNGCEVRTINMTVNNQGSNPVTITSASSTAPFSLNANNISIPANGTVNIPVTFAPTGIGTFTNVITLTLSDGETILVSVTGTTTKSPIVFSIPQPTYNVEPGVNQTIPVRANFGNFGTTQITSLRVTITFNPSIVSYVSNVSKIIGWNWIADAPVMISNTEASITFNGSGPAITTPSSTDLLDITFKPLLGNAEISDFVVSGDYQTGVCTQVTSATTKLQITNVCFLRGSQITSSGFTYGLMSAFPNPATSSTTVDFSIAFDAHTTIELVNPYGEVVRRLVDAKLVAGDYRQVMNLTDLPSGYYTLRCLSGLLNATTPIVITR